MADLELRAEPFIGGYSMDLNGTSLKEIADLALVSVACPLGGKIEIGEAIDRAWGISIPKPGTSEATEDGSIRLLGMAVDQFFAVLANEEKDPLDLVSRKLGAAGYYTDQTDNWVMLRLEGPLAIPALERVCPIDLEPARFPPGTVARTVMEHLGTIIMCEGESRYLLLSASSSAKSFLHAIETSVRNVS